MCIINFSKNFWNFSKKPLTNSKKCDIIKPTKAERALNAEGKMKYYVLVMEKVEKYGEIESFDGSDAMRVYETEEEAIKAQRKLWNALRKDEKNQACSFDLGAVDYSEDRWNSALEDQNGILDYDEEDEKERAKGIYDVYGFDERIKNLEQLKDEVFEETYFEDRQLSQYFIEYHMWEHQPEDLSDLLGISHEKADEIRALIKNGVRESGDTEMSAEIDDKIEEILKNAK